MDIRITSEQTPQPIVLQTETLNITVQQADQNNYLQNEDYQKIVKELREIKQLTEGIIKRKEELSVYNIRFCI